MNIHLKPQFPKKKKIRQQMHPPKLRPMPQCPNAPSTLSTPQTHLQVLKHLHHLPKIRRPQPRHRIPPLHRLKPIRPATRIVPLDDIPHELASMLVNRRVQEPQSGLPSRKPRLIDHDDHGSKHGRRRARPVNRGRHPAHHDLVVRAVGAEVRHRARLARVVEQLRAVRRRRVAEPRRHRRLLVAGEREEVAEAAAGSDGLVDGDFGLVARGEGRREVGDGAVDLRRADGGYVRARGGEVGVELTLGGC